MAKSDKGEGKGIGAEIAKREVQSVALDSVVLDPANARLHGPGSLEAIKDSLRLFEQVEPFGIQASTRKVIWGNGRVEAMRELGWTHADAIILDVDNATAAALGLALNRTAERSEWDHEAVGAILKSLSEDGFEVDKLGWTETELNVLIGEDGEDAGTDPNEEWEGMPEFEQEYAGPWKSILVHFANEKDMADFSRLVGQKITEKTKMIWHPQAEIIHAGVVEE